MKHLSVILRKVSFFYKFSRRKHIPTSDFLLPIGCCCCCCCKSFCWYCLLLLLLLLLLLFLVCPRTVFEGVQISSGLEYSCLVVFDCVVVVADVVVARGFVSFCTLNLLERNNNRKVKNLLKFKISDFQEFFSNIVVFSPIIILFHSFSLLRNFKLIQLKP